MSGAHKAVHPLITDAVTQASNHVLGLGPAVAAVNAYLGQAQAQAVLAANMVGQQQQQALTGLTSTVQNVGTLMTARRHGGTSTPSGASAARKAAAAPPSRESASTDYSNSMYQPPVVT
jgi:hypothetical protein